MHPLLLQDSCLQFYKVPNNAINYIITLTSMTKRGEEREEETRVRGGRGGEGRRGGVRGSASGPKHTQGKILSTPGYRCSITTNAKVVIKNTLVRKPVSAMQ